jgi:L-threonylcarbamoyladenylate synthase
VTRRPTGTGDVLGEPGAIVSAAAALRRGDVVCLPTESTYGLAVDIRSTAGLARLVALKGGRARAAPLGLIAADVAQAVSVASCWPAAAADLAVRHWPGPLTLVVPAAAGLAAALVGPGGGVGVRVSAHPWARALAAELGAPITATSANPSGQAPAVTAAAARACFGSGVAVYLDGGRCAGPVSTVVRVDADGAITILRAGAISLAGSLV